MKLIHQEVNEWQCTDIMYIRISLIVVKGLFNKKVVIICKESLHCGSINVD